ncbi:hypothetical protein GQ42DRAFT_150 [Ramicandelaber brevisporus]|nr:hypothetical protein GQ42DRAFT_150 [Ramicandelaber brevisporus]
MSANDSESSGEGNWIELFDEVRQIPYYLYKPTGHIQYTDPRIPITTTAQTVTSTTAIAADDRILPSVDSNLQRSPDEETPPPSYEMVRQMMQGEQVEVDEDEDEDDDDDEDEADTEGTDETPTFPEPRLPPFPMSAPSTLRSFAPPPQSTVFISHQHQHQNQHLHQHLHLHQHPLHLHVLHQPTTLGNINLPLPLPLSADVTPPLQPRPASAGPLSSATVSPTLESHQHQHRHLQHQDRERDRERDRDGVRNAPRRTSVLASGAALASTVIKRVLDGKFKRKNS